MFLRAIIENRTPNTLFNNQYFVTQYDITGIETSIVHIMLAFVMSKSSISSIDFKNLYGFTFLIIFLKSSGNGKFDSRRPLDEMIVAILN